MLGGKRVDSRGTHEGQAKCSCAAASILAVAAVAAEAASTVASGANAARASFDEEKKCTLCIGDGA